MTRKQVGCEDMMNIVAGGMITVTEEILLQLQRPRSYSRKGELPFMIVLKRARKWLQEEGRNFCYLPQNQIKEGFILFLPRGLRVGMTLHISWADDGCAAAVVKDRELIRVLPSEEIIVTQFMLDRMRDPRHIPSRGGLPQVLPLQKAPKRFGDDMYVVSDDTRRAHFYLFTISGLEPDSRVRTVWRAVSTAAAVPDDQYQYFMHLDDKEVPTSQQDDDIISRRGDDFVEAR